MTEIDHKVPGGKLLRLEVELDKEIIGSIKLSGDFFVHPETAIAKIEGLLEGKRIDEVEDVLNNFIRKNNIELIGFDASDLAKALERVAK
ncbi:MAG: lipoate protein ligase C-terminal domain-containing protein [Candidatus Woesearchaeota archaeon]